MAVMFPDTNEGFPAHEFSISEAFQQAGFNTALIGKWHLGDKPEFYPTRHGFDEWFGIPYSNDMKFLVEGYSFDDILNLKGSE